MTSHIRHRRLYDPTASFGPIEPGELAANTANRQIFLGDQTSGNPLTMLAVRMFAPTAKYATGDLVVQAGLIYRANGPITPGPWNASQWTLVSADISGLVAKAGDTMTGPLILYSSSPSASLEAVPKTYVDAGYAAVTTAFQNADAPKVNRAGDVMGGTLTLHADPVNALDAATKQYVDTHAVVGPPTLPEAPTDGKLYGRMNATWAQALPITGGTITTSLTMGTGAPLTLAGDPTSALQSATKQYVDAQITATESALVPPGIITMYHGAAAPAGWAFCNGSTVTAAANPVLASIYGSIAGNVTLPDLRDMVPIGQGTMGGTTNRGLIPASGVNANINSLNSVVGEATHLLSSTELPSHRHNVFLHDPQHVHGSGAAASRDGQWGTFGVGGVGWYDGAGNTGSSPTGITIGSVGGVANDNQTAAAGGGGVHNIVQLGLVVTFIIKLG